MRSPAPRGRKKIWPSFGYEEAYRGSFGVTKRRIVEVFYLLALIFMADDLLDAFPAGGSILPHSPQARRGV